MAHTVGPVAHFVLVSCSLETDQEDIVRKLSTDNDLEWAFTARESIVCVYVMQPVPHPLPKELGEEMQGKRTRVVSA